MATCNRQRQSQARNPTSEPWESHKTLSLIGGAIDPRHLTEEHIFLWPLLYWPHSKADPTSELLIRNTINPDRTHMSYSNPGM